LAKKANVHAAMNAHPRRTVAMHVQNRVWDLENLGVVFLPPPKSVSFNRRLTRFKILSHRGANAMEEERRKSLVAWDPAQTAAKAGESFGLMSARDVAPLAVMAYTAATMPKEYQSVFMTP